MRYDAAGGSGVEAGRSETIVRGCTSASGRVFNLQRALVRQASTDPAFKKLFTVSGDPSKVHRGGRGGVHTPVD